MLACSRAQRSVSPILTSEFDIQNRLSLYKKNLKSILLFNDVKTVQFIITKYNMYSEKIENIVINLILVGLCTIYEQNQNKFPFTYYRCECASWPIGD